MEPTFSFNEALEYMDHLVYLEELLEFRELLIKQKKRYSLVDIQILITTLDWRFKGSLNMARLLEYGEALCRIPY